MFCFLTFSDFPCLQSRARFTKLLFSSIFSTHAADVGSSTYGSDTRGFLVELVHSILRALYKFTYLRAGKATPAKLVIPVPKRKPRASPLAFSSPAIRFSLDSQHVNNPRVHLSVRRKAYGTVVVVICSPPSGGETKTRGKKNHCSIKNVQFVTFCMNVS